MPFVNEIPEISHFHKVNPYRSQRVSRLLESLHSNNVLKMKCYIACI